MAGLPLRVFRVELGARGYPIYIGGGLLRDPALYAPHVRDRRVLVVADRAVVPLYLDSVLAGLGAQEAQSLALEGGESCKSLATLERIVRRLLEGRYDRDSVIVALGGGVIGDVAGFAAACYQRGIAYLQAPTTLLAQVDSAVGGKTAVNHALGKNMIGAFYQPAAVIADMESLASLPDREIACGLAEVIKYGLVRDADLFSWLEENAERLRRRDPEALSHIVERSCRIKAQVVACDEREQGARALLNLGHTFGHAIETALAYRDWRHGEAVAVGLSMAADLSRRHGWLDAPTTARIDRLLAAFGLPLRPAAGLEASRLLELMVVDKKARSGRLRLVLLRALGDGFVTSDFSERLLRETLAEFCS